jgi:cyclase
MSRGARRTLGAGEILLTSIDREGTMEGYDLELIASVSRPSVSLSSLMAAVPRLPDMVRLFHAGASAVAAGALFQFT